MRALLRDAEDQALIALEVEEAVYDPEDQLLLLYAASGTNYEVSRIVRANADSMIKELAEKGFCDMTQSPQPRWKTEEGDFAMIVMPA